MFTHSHWTIGGLFETEERDRFHKFLESLSALLTSISSQKMRVDKETVFDYYIRPETKNVITIGDWEMGIPKWISFSQYMIPIIDSTKSKYINTSIAGLAYIRNEIRKERL